MKGSGSFRWQFCAIFGNMMRKFHARMVRFSRLSKIDGLAKKIFKAPTPANTGVGVDADSPISGSFQFPPVRHVQKDSIAGLVDTERLSFFVNMRDHHFRHFAGVRRKAPLPEALSF